MSRDELIAGTVLVVFGVTGLVMIFLWFMTFLVQSPIDWLLAVGMGLNIVGCTSSLVLFRRAERRKR